MNSLSTRFKTVPPHVLLPIWLLKELDHLLKINDVYPKKCIQGVHGHNECNKRYVHVSCTGLVCPYDRLSYNLVCLFDGWLVD